MQDEYIKDDAQKLDKFHTYTPPHLGLGSLLANDVFRVAQYVNIPRSVDDNARRGRSIFVKDAVLKYIFDGLFEIQELVGAAPDDDRQMQAAHLYVVMKMGKTHQTTQATEIWEQADTGVVLMPAANILAFPNEYYEDRIKVIHDQKIVFQGNTGIRKYEDALWKWNIEYYAEGEIRIPLNRVQQYYLDPTTGLEWPQWILEVWLKTWNPCNDQTTFGLATNTRVKFIDH